jgi:hypothetical protein
MGSSGMGLIDWSNGVDLVVVLRLVYLVGRGNGTGVGGK